MKKHIYRVIVIFIIVMSLSISFVMSASAQNTDNKLDNTIIEQIRDMIPLIDTDVLFDDDIWIGTPISAYHLNKNGKVKNSDYISYPIFINNDIKLIADVIKDDYGNASQVSLGFAYAKELQQELSKNPKTAYAIFFTDNGVFIKYQSDQIIDNNLICIKSFANEIDIINLNIEEGPDIKYNTPLPIIEIEVNTQTLTYTNTTLFNTLNISNVNNTSTLCCRNGICWAASIAIMSNYHLGTSYSAIQIHNRFNCLTSNYHNEEKSFINSLGMLAGGPYYSTGIYPFCFSTLYDCIEADMLLLLDLQDDNNHVAHNVVAYGYYGNFDLSLLYFYYMDPNTGGRISSFPSSSPETVYISLSGYNYKVHCYITAY